jgi:cobyrinic acid a,c-diamide synthase
LGCEIVDVSVSDEIIPPDVHALYVPHGLGYLSLVPLSANAPLRRDMGNLVFGKGLFAEGGGSLILGESIELPTGREVKGLGLMPVKGSFAESSGRREYIEVRGETDGSFLRKDEAMRGYWPEGISAKKSSAADRAEWGVWDVEDQARLSDDGFVIGRSVATQMRLEPWSAPDVFCRWLKSL